MIENSLITTIAALMFTPFLTKIQGAAFGLLTRQWHLAARGGLLLLLSTMITLVCGVIVAVVERSTVPGFIPDAWRRGSGGSRSE